MVSYKRFLPASSFTFGSDVVSRFLAKHDMDLICRAHQVSGLSCVRAVLTIRTKHVSRNNRSWKTVTSSLQSGNSSRSSRHPTIVER